MPISKKKQTASSTDPLDLWPVPKKKVVKKTTKKVSAAETKQKSTTKPPAVLSDKKTAQEKKQERQKAKDEAQKLYWLEIVREWADTLQNRFSSVRYEKIAYVVWQNIPECSIITQEEWLKNFPNSDGKLIARSTVMKWRVDDDFEEVRKYFVRRYLVQDTSKVLANLAKGAQFSWPFWPNIAAVKLFLQYAEEWSEQLKLDHDVKGGFSVNFGAAASPFTSWAAEVPVTKTKTPEKFKPQEETVGEPQQDDQEHQDNDAAAQ